tara:strand:- start:145 stop:321 length:177 start_codon:yes stop_codon:yes gene_type:complete
MKTQSQSICDEEHFYVYEKGSVDTERCWILSDRDVWYRNPHYRGEVTPHPEDDEEMEG